MNLVQFLVGFTFKLIQEFILILSKKQKDSHAIVVLIKYGDKMSRKLIISTIGLYLIEFMRNRFSSFIVLQVIKYLPLKNRILLLLFISRILELFYFKYSSKVIEFFFHNFTSKREKMLVIFSLIFFEELYYSKHFCRVFNKICTLRTFFSGFSNKSTIKLKIFCNICIIFSTKKSYIHSSVLLTMILFEFIRFNNQTNNNIIMKTIFRYGLLLSNSYQGLMLVFYIIDVINKKHIYKFLKKILTFASSFLKSKYGHIMLLLVFQNLDYTGKILRFFKLKNIISFDQNAKQRYSYYICLYLLFPDSQVFFKKKGYKLLKKKGRFVIGLSKRNKFILYDSLNNLLINLTKINTNTNLPLIISHFFEKINFGNNVNKFLFLYYTNQYILQTKNLKKYKKKLQDSFLFIKRISKTVSEIKSKMFFFELFKLFFNKNFFLIHNQFFYLDFYRYFCSLSVKKKKKKLFIDYNFINIYLPIKNQREKIFNCFLVDE